MRADDIEDSQKRRSKNKNGGPDEAAQMMLVCGMRATDCRRHRTKKRRTGCYGANVTCR